MNKNIKLNNNNNKTYNLTNKQLGIRHYSVIPNNRNYITPLLATTIKLNKFATLDIETIKCSTTNQQLPYLITLTNSYNTIIFKSCFTNPNII